MDKETLARIDELESLKAELQRTLFGREVTEYRAGGYDGTVSVISRIDSRIAALKAKPGEKTYTHVYVTIADPCYPEDDSEFIYAMGFARTFELSKGPDLVEMMMFIKGLNNRAVAMAEDSNDKEPSKVWDSSLREGHGDWTERKDK